MISQAADSRVRVVEMRILSVFKLKTACLIVQNIEPELQLMF